MENRTIQYINPNPVGYSDAVSVTGGRTIYISGQVALDHEGRVVAKGDLRGQTIQVFENLRKVLSHAGAEFHDVVKVNIYLVNCTPENVAIVRHERRHYLSMDNPPASTLVGVTSLVDPEFLIEIEVVAVVN